jgi:DNA-binding NarL/FixJ family response regulator
VAANGVPPTSCSGVSSGEEAVELARSLDLDVIIMDIDLPRMSGIEATRCIKSERRPQVVMLTGHEDTEHRKDALSAGASAFVPKRMMQAELLPALFGLLHGRNDEHST